MDANDRESQFERIFNEYRDMVFRVAFGVVRDRQRAEDVTQEAFVRAYRHLDSFEGRSSVKTWLYRVTVNASLDQLRSRRLAEPIPDGHDPANSTLPSHEAERQDLGRRLQSAIRELPERQQAAFVLKNQEGLAYTEIAEVLGVRLGTVKALVHQAMMNLRKGLGDAGL